jgi:hypothetical protein
MRSAVAAGVAAAEGSTYSGRTREGSELADPGGADLPAPEVISKLRAYQADMTKQSASAAATPALLHQRVTTDVRRAAQLIDTGLRAFARPA